jgi:hypothetical protein
MYAGSQILLCITSTVTYAESKNNEVRIYLLAPAELHFFFFCGPSCYVSNSYFSLRSIIYRCSETPLLYRFPNKKKKKSEEPLMQRINHRQHASAVTIRSEAQSISCCVLTRRMNDEVRDTAL